MVCVEFPELNNVPFSMQANNITMEPDELYNLRNFYWIGNYQVCGEAFGCP